MEIPWKFQVGKNIRKLNGDYGIPCEILPGITMEHDGFPWSFHTFLPTGNPARSIKTEPLKCRIAEFVKEKFHRVQLV